LENLPESVKGRKVKVEVEKKKGKLLGAGLPREMRRLPCLPRKEE